MERASDEERPPLTVIEEEEYQHAKAALGDVRRLDDALRGLEWSIVSRPEYWSEIVDGVRCAFTEPVGDVPRYMVYYDVVGEYAYLLHIEAIPGDPEK